MPPHIVKRGSTYYIADGRFYRSTKTDVKRLANAELERYNQGKFRTVKGPTVSEFYEGWIEGHGNKRRSLVRDYKQHFKSILKEFGTKELECVTYTDLAKFVTYLLSTGKSIKTCRNIVDASFRAMWRAARKEGIVQNNPFELVEWERQRRHAPDPFTVQERDKILSWWREKDFFFFPYVYVQFYTGMRPGEAAALQWSDVNLPLGLITISKSRDMGQTAAPKTKHSHRTIPVGQGVLDVLNILPSKDLEIPWVFVNKIGRPMTKKWAEHNWAAPLRELGIRHRKFYSTRHTFITQAINAGENPLAVAQYCGTSLAMIQQDYCGIIGLTKILQTSEKPLQNVVAGPGFEPRVIMSAFVQLPKRLRDLKGENRPITGKDGALLNNGTTDLRQD